MILGNDPNLRPLKQVLIERTEGNPFFIEESVRTLVETKILVGEGGNYRLAKPIESTQVPATVQAVLAARIDRLLPNEKRLLQSAAVIGKDVPFALLQAIADQSQEEIVSASHGSRPRSFFMRRVFFRRSNTPLSTPLHMRLLTGAFYKNGGASFMPVSWKRLRNYIRNALASKWSGLRITHRGASCGEKP